MVDINDIENESIERTDDEELFVSYCIVCGEELDEEGFCCDCGF